PIPAPTARQVKTPATLAPNSPSPAVCRVMTEALTILPAAITAVIERSICPISSTSSCPPTRIDSGNMASKTSRNVPTENIAWATPKIAANESAHWRLPPVPEGAPSADDADPLLAELEGRAPFVGSDFATATFAFQAP